MIKLIIKIIDELERLQYKLGKRQLLRRIKRESETKRKEDWTKYWKR